MLKRIREWRPFNRNEPIVTDEEHWHSAEELYSDASALLARYSKATVMPPPPPAAPIPTVPYRGDRPGRPLILEPGQHVLRQLNPYEMAAVRFMERS